MLAILEFAVSWKISPKVSKMYHYWYTKSCWLSRLATELVLERVRPAQK